MYAPRRGMGFMDTGLPSCSSMPAVSSTFQGPFACSGNQSDVPRFDASGQPVTQGALDSVWSYILAMKPDATLKPEYSFTDFVNSNLKAIGIAAAVIFGLAVVTRR